MKFNDLLYNLTLCAIALEHGASAIRHGYPSEATACIAFLCIGLMALLFPNRECLRCPAATRTPESVFCEAHTRKDDVQRNT